MAPPTTGYSLCSGFEMGNADDGGIWDSSASFSHYASAAYSGNYGGRATRASSGTSYNRKQIGEYANTDDWSVQVRFKIVTATDTEVNFISGIDSSTAVFGVRHSGTTGKLYDYSVQLGSNFTINTGTWYRADFLYVTSTRTLTMYLNGAQVATGTVNATYDNFQLLQVGWSSNATGDIYFDDVVACRSTSLLSNGTSDGLKVAQLDGTSNGTRDTGETAPTLGGSTSKGTEWGNLTDVPPDDAVSYVIYDATTEASYVVMGNATTVIPSGSTIVGVAVNARQANASGTTSQAYRRKVRGSSGTYSVLDGADITHNDTTWLTNGDVPGRYQAWSMTDPSTGSAWTRTNLASGQLGYKCYDQNPTSWCTGLWGLAVYYAPQTGYTLSVDAGSYSVSGQTATLARGLKITANSAEYVIAGQAAALSRGFTMAAAAASYALSVADTAWKRTYAVAANAGSYAVSGIAATLARGLKLGADAASYAVSGQAATFSRGYSMVAAAASYTVSVAEAAARRTYAVAASAGSYAISGLAATLARGLKLTADAGSYTFTGQAATFARGLSMVADAASYAVSVAAATSRRTYAVVGVATSYALSVSAATLARGLKLTADAGSYATTGLAATLAYGRAVIAAAGSFLVSGQDAVVAWGRKLAALLGEYVLTVNDATLTHTVPGVLQAGQASYAVSFSEATLTYSGDESARRPFWVPSGRPTIKALAANVFRGRPGRAPALGRGGRR